MTQEFHNVNVVNHEIDIQVLSDGTSRIKTKTPLGPYPEKMTDQLDHWAQTTPDTIFLAQRTLDLSEWRKLTYAEVLKKVKSTAAFLLEQNLSPDRPVMILSGNSIEHLIVGLAAMYIGVPYSPISTAYSLISTDFGKLKHIANTLTPGLVYVDNLGPYRDAIDACVDKDCLILASELDHGTDDFAYKLKNIKDVFAYPNNPQVDAANKKVNADTIAKFLFTSGSTGMPKGVINTQRMMCSNQEMLRSVFAFFKETPPVICDWLPWNHTFGGNHNTGIVLYNGGTLYIDEGKPVPHAIGHTIHNLTDIAPTVYFNVPKGYELLVKEFKKNEETAKTFFSKLQIMYFAGAGLSQHVWDELDALSIKYTGKKVPMLTGLGSTETAPAALFASIETCTSGVVGIPAPGIELKLVPNQGKQEVRIKGVSITPGYWRSPELTEKAYDEEGFYCLGDALKYIDPENPGLGFLFDGRVSEDFKLDTGTWVSAGQLKTTLIHHFAPYVQDCVIVGRDRGFISALIFPDITHCHALVDESSHHFSDEEIVQHPQVREHFFESLSELAERSTGSSTKIKRICLLSTPPKIDAHEVTDKGSLNSNAVIAYRSDEVNDLYSATPSDRIISL
jgi:feruloyl-CoA synthase